MAGSVHGTEFYINNVTALCVLSWKAVKLKICLDLCKVLKAVQIRLKGKTFGVRRVVVQFIGSVTAFLREVFKPVYFDSVS